MDPLSGIDSSVIDELMGIRAEESVLAARMRRMEELRRDTSPEVFSRVEKDYRSRAAALAEQAHPLERRAKAEFQKLEAVHRRLVAELEVARFDKEEQEFRHRIGEFDDPTFSERLRQCVEVVADRERGVAATDEVLRRFLAAFKSEEELRAESPLPDLPPSAPPPPPTSPAAPTLDPRSTAALSPTPLPPLPPSSGETGAPPPRPARPVSSGTVVLPPEPEADGEGTLVLPPRAGEGAGVTLALPAARLASQGVSGGEHLIAAVTYVGRTSENQIRLPSSSISRRHARIDLTPNGYLLTDLGSENGSYVNGVRVHEHLLADGDNVTFGTERFVFRLR